jgi:hypothetical protein
LNELKNAMYRVTVICSGPNDIEGSSSVSDILEEFTYRLWNMDTNCEWKDGILYFSATNDFDKDRLALLDEFGDAISACINYSGNIQLAIEAVKTL